jgi:hypothetical protein
MFVAYQPDLGLRQDARDEGIALLDTPGKFLP